MTVHPDSIDPRADARGLRWTIACDAPACHHHLHVGILTPGADPRMAAEITGWALDIDGDDYCRRHRELYVPRRLRLRQPTGEKRGRSTDRGAEH